MRKAFVAALALFFGALVLAINPGSASAGSEIVSYNLSQWDVSQSRSAGHMAITDEGLAVWTDDASSNAKAAAYYKAKDGLNLNNVGTPTIEWDGPQVQPGLQLIIDIPGGTGADGILVGESVHYGDNWWLTNGSSAELKSKMPERTGGGSLWYGTLAEWSEALEGQGWITHVGFSLGSGVYNSGVIKSLTFGGTKFTFKMPSVIERLPRPGYKKPTCDEPGSVILPDQVPDGVTYVVTDKDGWAKVTVMLDEGYILADRVKSEWRFKVAKRTIGCESPSPTPTQTEPEPTTDPDPEPSPTMDPEPSPTVDPSPTVEPSPTMIPTKPVGNPSGGLPLTGSSVLAWAGIGGAMIAFGGILVMLVRRKRDHEVSFTS